MNPGLLTRVEMVHPALLGILPFSSLSHRGGLVSVPGRKRMNPPLGDCLGKSSVLQKLMPSGCPRAQDTLAQAHDPAHPQPLQRAPSTPGTWSWQVLKFTWVGVSQALSSDQESGALMSPVPQPEAPGWPG